MFKIIHAQQDLSKNFIPLKSSGSLPSIFTQDIRKVIRQDIEQMQDSAKKHANIKAQYFTSSNYQIERLIRSGNTLLNDEISAYLNQIVDVLLKNDPALRSKISVYTLKSAVVNAHSYDKGYVSVNIALVAQAETEAQLAYLLCHEIMHYVKHHQISSYVNQVLIENGTEYENKQIEKCQYSKELESEADIGGFKLLEQTAYNPRQSLKLFDVLQYSSLPFELVEFKKSFFETKDYIIPDSYLLKELSPIKDNSNADDAESTHPNIAKRKMTIAEKVKFSETRNKADFIIGKEKFEYIRDLARMELCRLYLRERDYPNALYAAYLLKKKYPDNEYVNEIICKCLYALSLYKNDQIRYTQYSHLSEGFPSAFNVEGYQQQLYYFIEKMPANEFTIMSLNYTYRIYKKFPQNHAIRSCSDSLLGMMKKIDWKISDFNRTAAGTIISNDTSAGTSKTDLIVKIRKVSNKEDSVYYKNVFSDLLSTDRYFSEKFPLTAPAYGFDNEDKGRRGKKSGKNAQEHISKALFIEPLFYRISKRNELSYIESDIKQEKFASYVAANASSLGFGMIMMDPGLLSASDVGKMNDYSIVNDWLTEKFDSGQDKIMIFNTDEIEDIVKKHGTKYLIQTGIISKKTKTGNRTFFFFFVTDLLSNQIVFKKEERFKRKDRADLMNAKVYQMIYGLK